MNFSVLAPAMGSVLAGQPLAIAEELDPGTVYQQVQRACRATARYLDGDGFLEAAQSGKVGHRPVQPGHRQDAAHHPGRLLQRQAEQHFHHQTKTGSPHPRKQQGDRCDRPWVPATPCPCPARSAASRAASARRCRLPVRRAVAGGSGLAHASLLTHRILKVNPHWSSSATTPSKLTPASQGCNGAMHARFAENEKSQLGNEDFHPDIDFARTGVFACKSQCKADCTLD